MSLNDDGNIFHPDVPPDLSHASLIRAEAVDWLDSNFPGSVTFPGVRVLAMAGEQKRRWLIGRLREHGTGGQKDFDLPATVDALTIMFLRYNGVKFRDAVDAVIRGSESLVTLDSRNGGVWNRLIDISLKRIQRRLTARLLGSVVYSLLRDESDQPNCLVIIKRLPAIQDSESTNPEDVPFEYAFKLILERPAPSCWVLSPFREVLFLDEDQLPTRSEVTERHFIRLRVKGERESYDLLLGTTNPASISPGRKTTRFIERILEIVFLDIEEFLRVQSSQRHDVANLPGLSNSDNLQLWLITQLLDTI